VVKKINAEFKVEESGGTSSSFRVGYFKTKRGMNRLVQKK
jgi:hypothetical protein